ncbi:MAG: hypothetical protein ACPKPY_12835 [Nitrososphaeraceae archaeon]
MIQVRQAVDLKNTILTILELNGGTNTIPNVKTLCSLIDKESVYDNN